MARTLSQDLWDRVVAAIDGVVHLRGRLASGAILLALPVGTGSRYCQNACLSTCRPSGAAENYCLKPGDARRRANAACPSSAER